MRVLLMVACLGAAGLTGCTEEIVLDGGMDPPTGPPRVIALEGEPTLTLLYGETVPIRARLTEEGRAVADAALRFTFESNAQDSTLGDLDLATDTEGRAETTLQAGEVSAVFRVRVSAERADPAFLQVAVGNEGFGGLVVTTRYEGERAYARRVLNVYADVACDDPDGFPRSPARTQVLDDPATASATFLTLAADLTYTVVARAEGPTGAPLATACLDGVRLTRDERTEVPLTLVDLSLVPEGGYDAELVVETMFFAPVLQIGIDATAGVSDATAAARLLDALEVELTSRPASGELARLQAERTTAETSLANRLAMAGEGPSAAAQGFFEGLRDRLEGVRVAGPLELTLEGSAIDAAWTAESLVVGPMPAPDAPMPLFLDPTQLALEPTLAVRWPGAETLEVDALQFSLPIGELVTETMRAAEIEAGGPGAALAQAGGCAALDAWIAESPYLSAVCDAACAEAACFAALAPVYQQARDAIAAAELDRDGLAVSGAVTLHDDDADLLVDRIDGQVDGTWHGVTPTTADEVSGTLRGARVVVTE